MRLIGTIFLGLLLSGCYSQRRTISFVNQSGNKIDSIRIVVSSADVYSIKHSNFKVSDTVITSIPHNVPKSNKHDISIEITIYIKNHDLIYSYNYDDLAGSLLNDYTIVLNKEQEVKWFANSTIGGY